MPGERLRLLHAEVAARSLDPMRVVPLLAPVLGIGGEAGYEPVAAEGRKLYELIAAGVQEYLLACVGGGAGLLVAKDVHWFDPSTVEVLGRLLGVRGGRLLVVMTGQGGGWLPACWPVKVFDLQPLTDEQADDADHRLGSKPVGRGSGGGARPLRRRAVVHRAAGQGGARETGRRLGRDAGAGCAV